MTAANVPNRALEPFASLIGEWKTMGTHPLVPNTVFRGSSSFEWIEGGAFLIWRSQMDHKDFPAGIAIFGSDDAAGTYYMLYFDERNVSRKYDVSIGDGVLKWWRNMPGFSQRYTWTFVNDEEGGNSIVGQGELCQDGTTWKRDLDLTFVRVLDSNATSAEH